MGFPFSLGFSFGKQKTKETRDTTLNKTEATNQSQTENTTGTKTNTTTGTSTQSNQSQGNAVSTQSTKSGEVRQSQQQQTGSQSSFSNDFVTNAEAKINNLFDSLGTDRAAINDRVGAIKNIDVGDYVNRAVAAATATQRSALDEGIGGIGSALGGTENENTAAALLAQRLRNESSATLGGVAAGAEAEALKINRENALASAQALGSQGNILADIVNALKGANVSTAQNLTGTERGETSASGQANNQTSETSTQTQQSTSQAIETLTQTINALLQGLTTTNAVENVKGTTTGKSFGLTGSIGGGK